MMCMIKLSKVGIVLLLSVSIYNISFAQIPAASKSDGYKNQQQSLYNVLKQLEVQYQVNFIYNSTVIEEILIDTRLIYGNDIKKILNRILKTNGLDYEKHGKIYAVVPGTAVNSKKSRVKKGIIVPGSKISAGVKVTGIVTETDGKPIPGVNIILEQTSTGTITDSAGKFELMVLNTESFLVFSYLGYITQRPKIGSQNSFHIKLAVDTKMLKELLVTALGFKEEADKLGMTSSQVTGIAIARSGENNLINSLSAKASGLIISRTGADPGSGSAIQIRGINTITGNNQPLVIMDGFPISSSMLNVDIFGPSQQSRLNDINPADIETVQILKGASAAAVWGSRAANGVIIVTTKTGNKDKLSVSYDVSLSLDRVNAYYPRQSTYGQGTNGSFSSLAAGSWGDKIADRTGGEDEVNKTGEFFKGQSGKIYFPVIKKNSREVFTDENYNHVFRTGVNWNHTLGISGGNEKSTYYFSAGDLNQKGVLNGNSDYKRNSFKLNTDHSFGKIFHFTTHSAFSKISSKRQGRNYELSGPPATLLSNPPDFDQSDYIGDYYTGPMASPVVGRQRSYLNPVGARVNPLAGNPNWALHQQIYSSDVNRFINGFELNVKPVDWFDLTARAGYDFNLDSRLNYYPLNDLNNSGNGQYFKASYKEAEWSTDVVSRFYKRFNRSISFTYVAGFNVNDRNYEFNAVQVTNFITGNFPVNPSNAANINTVPASQTIKTRSARVYNTLNVSLFNSLFLNASLAGEASSTFGGESNKSFYYPSVDLAWQFSKVNFLRNSEILTFGKLRASYGVVGIQPQPYKSSTLFNPTIFNQGLLGLGDFVNGALFGTGAYMQAYELGNKSLKPEVKTEYEVGLDLRLFSNKLKTSLSFYHDKVNNILISVTQPSSTGFGNKYANGASLQNNGFEVDLGMDIIHTPGFNWSVNGNFSRVRNRVTDLSSSSVIVSIGGGVTRTVAIVGQPMGVFYSGKYLRSDDGALVLNSNKFPQISTSYGIVGNPNPDFTAGLNSAFSYKKLSLQLLFETSQGADFFEATRGAMYSLGTHADVGHEVTLQEDTRNYTGKVFPAGTTVRGNLHNFGGGQVLLDESYYTSIGGGYSDVKEHLISDGSWTRLRQASLSYMLDSPRFKKWSGLQFIDLSVTGRNLFLWTKVKGVDPDTNTTGALFSRSQDYFNPPGIRSFVFSIRVNY